MKEFLSREGYTFTEKNVEEDAAAYDELLSLKFRTIPVTVIGPHAVTGFDAPKLLAALRSAGGS